MKKREIGGGWKEVDDGSGKIFYVNKKLRKRQWDWPEDVPRENDREDMELPGPPADDDFPPPPDEGDMPVTTGSMQRLNLASIAKETAATTVTADDLDAAKRRLMGGKKRDEFGKVNVRKLIDEDVDGEWDYMIKDFATDAFDLKVSGGFFGSHKVKMSDLLKHTTKQMSQGLLKRSNDDSDSKDEASQMHKNILSYMGDRKSGKDKMGHTQKILRYALEKLNDDDDDEGRSKRRDKDAKSTTQYPGLWDEIYCQLVKQTTQNEKVDSLVSGFELFTLCAGTWCLSAKRETFSIISLSLVIYLENISYITQITRELLEHQCANAPRIFTKAYRTTRTQVLSSARSLFILTSCHISIEPKKVNSRW